MIYNLFAWYVAHWYLFAVIAVIALVLAGTERRS